MIQRSTDKRIDTILRSAAEAAEAEVEKLAGRQGFGSMVRDAQLRAAQTAVARVLADMWGKVGDETRAGQERARVEALRQSFDWDAVLLRAGVSGRKADALRAGLLSGAQFNVEAALERVYFTRVPLSQQVWRSMELSTGWLDRVINDSLARGATAAELAKQVRGFVRPDVRGGAAFAARRLARTEINNAYHAVTIVHNEDKPWNLGMQWSLSGSHPAFDECDVLARQNDYGLGKGVFPKGKVPRKPHPQCLCYTYPKTLSIDEWLSGYKSGKFDDYIAMAYGG